MNFDWVLFLGIAIIGPYFGGMICALLEKGITGEARHDNKFRKKRTTVALISIAFSFIATEQLASLINQIYVQRFHVLVRVLTIATGIAIYLLFQAFIYAILIRRS